MISNVIIHVTMDIKNSKMRKLILSFLFVLSAMVGFAQSFSKDKLFISVEVEKVYCLENQTCHLLVLVIVEGMMEV